MYKANIFVVLADEFFTEFFKTLTSIIKQLDTVILIEAVLVTTDARKVARCLP